MKPSVLFQKPKFWLFISLVITISTLAPNLNNGFTNWDDEVYVTQNPLIKDLSFTGIKEMFITEKVHTTYSPLVLLSWSLDYALAGLNGTFFHLTNLLLHLLVVALVFYLSLMITKRIEIAFFTALLFGIHPMHVEAVSWVSARKDLLYTLFFVAGLVVYFKYSKVVSNMLKKYFLLISCFVLYVCALFSKGTAIVFPFVLLLIDYLNNRKNLRKCILEKIPFLILAVIFFYIALKGQQDSGAMSYRQHNSYLEALAVGFYGYFTYLIKVIIPFKLSTYHPYPNGDQAMVPWYFYISALVVILFLVVTFLKARKNRILIFGVSFFFVSLLPLVQILPFGTSYICERYTYLPYFGIFLCISIVLLKLYESLQPFFRKGLLSVIVIYIFSMGIISFLYSKTFKNTETLWTNVATQYPDDYMAYMNRTNYRVSKDKKELALKDANRAIEKHKGDPFFQLYYNRGFVCQVLNKYELAIKEYSKTIQLNKEYVSAYLNRGIVYEKIGADSKAFSDYEIVKQLAPKNFKGYYNSAVLHKKRKEYKQCILNINKIIALGKLLPGSYTTRGELYLNQNEYDRALLDFNKAIKLDSKKTKAYLLRGNIYLIKRELIIAEKDFLNVLELDKKNIQAHINLGLIYLNQSKYSEALSYFNKAVSLEPNNYLIYYNRALLYKKRGANTLAIKDFESVLVLNKNHKKSREELRKMNVTKN